ncbi:13823_t:CDS:2 [Ambispora leptoticha]|uniref:13823_t:CDS:1 n=1 Tax=Ambispora leptoticha TaxID=144679 RepID=A0A9N8Z5R7_9GLOM|nr:13823_t:CDS:2 [Ambispora leptoticha]
MSSELELLKQQIIALEVENTEHELAHSYQVNTPKQISQNGSPKNTPDNTLNYSNIHPPEPVSPEDKMVDEFVNSMYKEQVSNDIIQSIREKKLRDQELLSTSENNICHEQSLIQEKCQEISVTNHDDRQKNFSDPDIETKEHLSQESSGSKSPNHNIYVSEEPDEIEPTKKTLSHQFP